jgi:DNA polymerase III alpha subunit
VLSAWEVKQAEQGRRVRAAGMMAVRQRPATAKGIVFISLEDESGLLDSVVKPEVWARLRDVLRGSMLLVVEGTVQRSGRAVSLLVQEAETLDARLPNSLGIRSGLQARAIAPSFGSREKHRRFAPFWREIRTANSRSFSGGQIGCIRPALAPVSLLTALPVCASIHK